MYLWRCIASCTRNIFIWKLMILYCEPKIAYFVNFSLWWQRRYRLRLCVISLRMWHDEYIGRLNIPMHITFSLHMRKELDKSYKNIPNLVISIIHLFFLPNKNILLNTTIPNLHHKPQLNILQYKLLIWWWFNKVKVYLK